MVLQVDFFIACLPLPGAWPALPQTLGTKRWRPAAQQDLPRHLMQHHHPVSEAEEMLGQH